MIMAAEYRERMQRLQRMVHDHGLDAFVVATEDSIFYLTGISFRPLERPFFIIVRPETEPVLLVPALERDHLHAAPNVSDVQHYWDYPSPPGQGWPERLLSLLDGFERVGVEPGLPLEVATHLRSPKVLPLVEALRLVKSVAEVEMLRHAARYADQGVRRVLQASYFGVSEIELFSQARPVQIQIMREVGYDVLTSSILVGSWPAPLSAQPHGVPTIADRLRDGPHIALCVPRVNGYTAECERTYFLAPPTTQTTAAFAAMLEARRRAYSLIRPGVPCAEVDLAAKTFLIAEGYGDHLLHRTGHGFGLSNHEAPWIAEGNTDVLQENTVISVEPGIYLPGIGGIRHSDTVLVTRTGYENLTKFPTDLAAVTITAGKPMTRLRGALVRKAAGIK